MNDRESRKRRLRLYQERVAELTAASRVNSAIKRRQIATSYLIFATPFLVAAAWLTWGFPAALAVVGFALVVIAGVQFM